MPEIKKLPEEAQKLIHDYIISLTEDKTGEERFNLFCQFSEAIVHYLDEPFVPPFLNPEKAKEFYLNAVRQNIQRGKGDKEIC